MVGFHPIAVVTFCLPAIQEEISMKFARLIFHLVVFHKLVPMFRTFQQKWNVWYEPQVH